MKNKLLSKITTEQLIQDFKVRQVLHNLFECDRPIEISVEKSIFNW